jgi:hypothetical protein
VLSHGSALHAAKFHVRINKARDWQRDSDPDSTSRSYCLNRRLSMNVRICILFPPFAHEAFLSSLPLEPSSRAFLSSLPLEPSSRAFLSSPPLEPSFSVRGFEVLPRLVLACTELLRYWCSRGYSADFSPSAKGFFLVLERRHG